MRVSHSTPASLFPDLPTAFTVEIISVEIYYLFVFSQSVSRGDRNGPFVRNY